MGCQPYDPFSQGPSSPLTEPFPHFQHTLELGHIPVEDEAGRTDGLANRDSCSGVGLGATCWDFSIGKAYSGASLKQGTAVCKLLSSRQDLYIPSDSVRIQWV